MSDTAPPPRHASIQVVGSFRELLETPFAAGMNALCWPRLLEGNFAEVVAALGEGEGIVPLDDSLLLGLPLSVEGSQAVQIMLTDRRRLAEAGLEPELNIIHHYPRDQTCGPITTDVLSFHVDSATAEADTWLCTYHGAPSEGLLNEEALLKADIPEIFTKLLEIYDSSNNGSFPDFLAGNCYDLHYSPLPHAVPYSFGVGNLWRIATDWPGSPVLPCIHRAPETQLGDPVRLLLIS